MNYLELIQNKIVSDSELRQKLAYWRFRNFKIVFTNGCFDILHLGHIDYLSKASDLGEILIVGVNTDASVKRLKGSHRPINDEYARASVLASLQFVHAVVLFGEDTPYELIKIVQPNILVKGKDYRPEEIIGYDILQQNNGEVVTIDLVEGYSTSLIERKIKESSI